MKKTLMLVLIIVIVISLASAVYAQNVWQANKIGAGVVDPSLGYLVNWRTFYHAVPNPGPDEVYPTLDALLAAYGFADLDAAHAAGFEYYKTELEGLTDQVWAVQVSAAPGHSGTLHQSFEAAYGPFGGFLTNYSDKIPPGDKDKWFFRPDKDGIWDIKTGEDYVGNYFTINQLAKTSDGQIKRYISISSPWSHGMVEVDMITTGAAEIAESFYMINIEPGDKTRFQWWDLF